VTEAQKVNVLTSIQTWRRTKRLISTEPRRNEINLNESRSVQCSVHSVCRFEHILNAQNILKLRIFIKYWTTGIGNRDVVAYIF